MCRIRHCSVLAIGRRYHQGMKQLERLLKERKISLRTLSTKTGVPVSTLAKWIAGTHSASAPALLKVARYLKVSMERLLDEPESISGDFDQLIAQLPNEFRTIFKGEYRITIEKRGKDE